MTATARKYPGAKAVAVVTKEIVDLNATLRPLSKAEIQAKLARNTKSGRVAEMSFSDAGLKVGEL